MEKTGKHSTRVKKSKRSAKNYKEKLLEQAWLKWNDRIPQAELSSILFALTKMNGCMIMHYMRYFRQNSISDPGMNGRSHTATET